MRTGQVIASAQEELATAKRTRKRRLVCVGVVLVILIAASSVVGKKNLVRVFQMSKTRTELQQEINRLRQVNGDFTREIQALVHNPSQVEAIAREDLGLVKPGEIVYQFGPQRRTTALPAPSR
jgi:cell division protein FtsB